MPKFDKGHIDQNTFCFFPFAALYMGPDQGVMPCCVTEWGKTLGKASSKESLIQIFNNDQMKSLRRNLVNGVRDSGCATCWKSESLGGRSMRTNFNKKYEPHLGDIIENIDEDYAVKEVKFLYLDIRFSNICNLKCRSCSSQFSSMWAADEEKLNWNDNNPNRKKIKISVGETDILPYLIEQLPNVKEIYFAGGEPLIQDEHYAILDKIIELGLENQIEIRYNTNFSKLTHRGKDVLAYWKKFPKVTVGASLDGNHDRGEYIRKGLEWTAVVENRKRMLAEVPGAGFHISLTLSIMNAYNVVEFHREWVNLGLIKPYEFMLNLLFNPDHYKLSNLPDNHKDRVITEYQEHIRWLNTFASGPDDKSMNSIISGFQSAISLLAESQNPRWPSDWINHNQALDNIRNEEFVDVFPEYGDFPSNSGYLIGI